MKKLKILVVSAILVCFSISGFAQNIEIIPYMNYQFASKLRFYDGEIRLGDGENYGIALSVDMPLRGGALQAEFFSQNTYLDVRWYGQLGDNSKRYEVNMNWYQIGFMQEFGGSEELQPYGGITLGAVHFSPRSTDVESKTKFAVTGQLGVKYYFSEKLGLRLSARLLMPIQWGGFGIYAGSGGVGTGVTVGSSIFSGDVGGGIVFRLGTK